MSQKPKVSFKPQIISRHGQSTGTQRSAEYQKLWGRIQRAATDSLIALKAGQEPDLHQTFNQKQSERFGTAALTAGLLYTPVHSGGFPGGSEGKESACNVEDLGLIPGLGRSLGEGNGNLL